MPLTPGSRLGPYDLTALLGEGGMGQVYRATDTNLKRSVAIKVLPVALAGDADRLARFQREAEVLAALNHPNIAAIYGLEKSEGITALVMELVDGDDLSQRIARGAMPLDEALPIAKQIAEALEAAHEQGIIHRDLKPANIKVRSDGTVKVLDFGLAKAMDQGSGIRDGGAAGISMSPTITTPAMTQAGMILGTAAYMAPEQARGKTVDKRADIWAFGAVLFEMLTGQRAFEAEDISMTLSMVLQREPDFAALPSSVPARISQVLRVCLRKDLKQRVGDIHDVRLALEGAFETVAPLTTGTATPPVPSSASRMPWAVAAAVAMIAVVTSLGWWRATRPVEQALRPLVRLDVDLGADVSLGAPSGTDTIISPDGTRLVYVSQGRLFTRRLDQPTATALAGTQGAYAPFFSPDGQWVAFFTQATLRKISVEGGSAVTLCGATTGFGGSWGADGTIIATLSSRSGLSRVPAAGGAPTPLTDLQSGEATHRWPQTLPGGKAVLFTTSAALGAYDAGTIEVLSLANHRRTTLVRGGTFGRYLPSGHLVYVNRGTLFAVPFDLNRLELQGTPAPVLDQVGYRATDGSAQLAFSETGTLLYRSGGAGGGLLTVALLDATGKAQPLLKNPGAYNRLKMSPDGSRLALDNAGDVWTYDWQRDIMTRLTFNGGGGAVWSPDNRFILYNDTGGIGFTRSDGGTAPHTLIAGQNALYPWSFSPDGKRLAYLEITSGGYDLYTVSIENNGTTLKAGTPEPFLKTPADERYPSFSPDGRWVMYTSSESGTFQVYVRAFPDNGGKWQISSDDGAYPTWSSDRRTIFFRTRDNHIMVVNYTARGDAFTSEKPRLWRDESLADVGSARSYDLHPDGKRIVALMPVETAEGQQAQSHVIFLQNFFDELRRKVPVGK